jgi:hypothetical protein
VPCYPAFIIKSLRDINVGAGKITLLGTIVLRFPTYESHWEDLEESLNNEINENKSGSRKES